MSAYLLLYDTADDVLDTAPVHYDAHCEVLAPFRESGAVLFASPLDDPRNGAVSIWVGPGVGGGVRRRAIRSSSTGVVSRWHLIAVARRTSRTLRGLIATIS